MKYYLILENQSEQAEALSVIIRRHKPDASVYTAASVSEALPLLTLYSFDLFFLDIHLAEGSTPAGNGIAFGRLLRTLPAYQNTPVIYVTSFSEHIQEAVNHVHCYGFLQKPYTAADVCRLLDGLSATAQASSLQLRTREYIFREIPFVDLLHVSSRGKYLTYHTQHACHVSRQYTMQTLTEILPDYFIRCHKSHLFNQHYFSCYDTVNQCVLLKHYREPIPVGRSYKDYLLNI